jgi:hypothetical protein
LVGKEEIKREGRERTTRFLSLNELQGDMHTYKKLFLALCYV